MDINDFRRTSLIYYGYHRLSSDIIDLRLISSSSSDIIALRWISSTFVGYHLSALDIIDYGHHRLSSDIIDLLWISRFAMNIIDFRRISLICDDIK